MGYAIRGAPNFQFILFHLLFLKSRASSLADFLKEVSGRGARNKGSDLSQLILFPT
jgi:hypothetical protein